MRTHVFYLILLATLAMLVASTELRASREAIVVIGAIGLWRYGWAAINFARAIWFRRIAYPRRKAIAHQKYAERQIHARAHFLVTSYKIPNEVSVKVYRSVFAAAKRSKGPAQVVASVVELSDVMLIQTLYQQLVGTDDQVELIIDRIPGTGKRDALAAGLRQIAKSCPTEHDVLVVVDGDTCVPEDVVEQSAPFFTNPLVGALTTDRPSPQCRSDARSRKRFIPDKPGREAQISLSGSTIRRVGDRFSMASNRPRSRTHPFELRAAASSVEGP